MLIVAREWTKQAWRSVVIGSCHTVLLRRYHEPAAPTLSPQASGLQPLPPAIAQALADPIVRALMAADRVDADALTRLLRELVARLAPPRC
jgi:hypothetical protein